MAAKTSQKDDSTRKGGASKKAAKPSAKPKTAAKPEAAASTKATASEKKQTPPKSAANIKKPTSPKSAAGAKSKPLSKIETDILDLMKAGTTPGPLTPDRLHANLKTHSLPAVNDALEALAAKGTIEKSFALKAKPPGGGGRGFFETAILRALCPPPSAGGGWSQDHIIRKIADGRTLTADVVLAISDELEILSRPGGEIRMIDGLYSRDCSKKIS